MDGMGVKVRKLSRESFFGTASRMMVSSTEIGHSERAPCLGASELKCFVFEIPHLVFLCDFLVEMSSSQMNMLG